MRSPHAREVCEGSVAPSAEEVAKTTWWSPESDLAALGGSGQAPLSGPGSGEAVATLPRL